MEYTDEVIKQINRKINKLEERLENLDKHEAESLRERILIKRELEELNKLLLIDPEKSGNDFVIGLGSRFSMTITSEELGEDTSDYIVSETNIQMPGFLSITTKSPLGKAVIGKEAGDVFSYTVNGFINTGVINEIYRFKMDQDTPKQKTIEK